MADCEFQLPEALREIINSSERVFWVNFAENGRVTGCSPGLPRLLNEFDSLEGRSIDEIFLPSLASGNGLSLAELNPGPQNSPVLVRLALSGRPCRVIAVASATGIFCWGEVIGDHSTTGLNELSSLTGKIQELLSEVRRQKELVEKDLEAASWLQRRLLPQQSSYLGLETAWKFRPCDKVGGDLFGIFVLPDKSVATYLIDVSGHGVPSAMMGVAVAQVLQQFVMNYSLAAGPQRKMIDLLARLEEEFPLERFNLYFTMVYLEYHPENSRVSFVNAGHPAPILQHAKGGLNELIEAGPFIGMDQSELIPVQDFPVGPGDRLFVYSDGLTERRDPEGGFFDKQRLLSSLENNQKLRLSDLVDEIVAENDSFAQHLNADDDLTLLGLEFSSLGNSL